jgi:hypothetical protein
MTKKLTQLNREKREDEEIQEENTAVHFKYKMMLTKNA